MLHSYHYGPTKHNRGIWQLDIFNQSYGTWEVKGLSLGEIASTCQLVHLWKEAQSYNVSKILVLSISKLLLIRPPRRWRISFSLSGIKKSLKYPTWLVSHLSLPSLLILPTFYLHINHCKIPWHGTWPVRYFTWFFWNTGSAWPPG